MCYFYIGDSWLGLCNVWIRRTWSSFSIEGNIMFIDLMWINSLRYNFQVRIEREREDQKWRFSLQVWMNGLLIGLLIDLLIPPAPGVPPLPCSPGPPWAVDRGHSCCFSYSCSSIHFYYCFYSYLGSRSKGWPGSQDQPQAGETLPLPAQGGPLVLCDQCMWPINTILLIH